MPVSSRDESARGVHLPNFVTVREVHLCPGELGLAERKGDHLQVFRCEQLEQERAGGVAPRATVFPDRGGAGSRRCGVGPAIAGPDLVPVADIHVCEFGRRGVVHLGRHHGVRPGLDWIPAYFELEMDRVYGQVIGDVHLLVFIGIDADLQVCWRGQDSRNGYGHVCRFGVCYHIQHPEDALIEIGRVLDTSGTFVYETPLAQSLAHPRSDRQRLPWEEAPSLIPDRSLVLWASRRKASSGCWRCPAREIGPALGPGAGLG